MVASGYSASTASSTLVFVSPVSNCSSDRCGCDGSTADWPEKLAVVVVPSSARALSVPARIPPAIAPLAIRPAAPPHRRHALVLPMCASLPRPAPTSGARGATDGACGDCAGTVRMPTGTCALGTRCYPLRLQRAQPPDRLRAAGLDGGEGPGAAPAAAATQVQRPGHLAVRGTRGHARPRPGPDRGRLMMTTAPEFFTKAWCTTPPGRSGCATCRG